MSEIIPAVLAKDVADLEAKLKEIPEEISFAHIDVLSEDIWSRSEIAFEAHLMVEEPDEVVERWIARGAKRIITHKLNEEVLGHKGEVEIGLALEMHVPISGAEALIPKADFVQLMSIAEIGEQGHPLDERIFARIREVKEKFPGTVISVDGGVNVSNYKRLEEAGADRLVVGSGFKALWTSLTKS